MAAQRLSKRLIAWSVSVFVLLRSTDAQTAELHVSMSDLQGRYVSNNGFVDVSASGQFQAQRRDSFSQITVVEGRFVKAQEQNKENEVYTCITTSHKTRLERDNQWQFEAYAPYDFVFSKGEDGSVSLHGRFSVSGDPLMDVYTRSPQSQPPRVPSARNPNVSPQSTPIPRPRSTPVPEPKWTPPPKRQAKKPPDTTAAKPKVDPLPRSTPNESTPLLKAANSIKGAYKLKASLADAELGLYNCTTFVQLALAKSGVEITSAMSIRINLSDVKKVDLKRLVDKDDSSIKGAAGALVEAGKGTAVNSRSGIRPGDVIQMWHKKSTFPFYSGHAGVVESLDGATVVLRGAHKSKGGTGSQSYNLKNWRAYVARPLP